MFLLLQTEICRDRDDERPKRCFTNRYSPSLSGITPHVAKLGIDLTAEITPLQLAAGTRQRCRDFYSLMYREAV